MCTTCGITQRSRTACTNEALIGRLIELAGLESRLPLRLRLCVQTLGTSNFSVWRLSLIARFLRCLNAAILRSFLSSSTVVSVFVLASSMMSSSLRLNGSSCLLLILSHSGSRTRTFLTFFLPFSGELSYARIFGLTNLPLC